MIKNILILTISMTYIFGCQSSSPGGEVLASVNKTQILLKEFQSEVTKINQYPGSNLAQPGKRRELLEEMVKQELIIQAALKENIVETSPRLKKEIVSEYLQRKMAKVPEPTPQELEAIFNAKKVEIEKVRASHILFKPKNTQDEKSWDEVQKKAETVLKKMKVEGKKLNFAKYAQLYSQDTANASTGGGLNWFDRVHMVKPFSDAAFALKNIGDISDTVRTEYGFHIIQLTGDQRGLDFAKPMISVQLKKQRQMEKINALFEELQKKASIKIDNDVLAKANLETK